MRRKLAAGNWKMHGVAGDLSELDALADAHAGFAVDVLLCPPATLIGRMADRIAALGLDVALGAQDCHAAASGAHTGDISAAMLADAGASHVILGHSERRADHAETDAIINARIAAAWGAGLTALLCIGETGAQYKAGVTLDVLRAQLDGSLPDPAAPGDTVIAYEPVWAIGTGLIPSLDQIATVHGAIRAHLADRFTARVADGIRILYGGSVKAGNAAGIFALADVDGALVGGASLKAADFSPIIAALESA